MLQVSNNLPTDCWRYEFPDGGGPWFHPDGRPRDINNVPPYENNKNVLCGCDTIENLNRYMIRNNVDITKMFLVHYFDIKVLEYNSNTGHVIFSKEGFE